MKKLEIGKKISAVGLSAVLAAGMMLPMGHVAFADNKVTEDDAKSAIEAETDKAYAEIINVNEQKTTANENNDAEEAEIDENADVPMLGSSYNPQSMDGRRTLKVAQVTNNVDGSSTTYDSFSDAWNNGQQASSDITIRLLADCERGWIRFSTDYYIKCGNKVKLELNGYDILADQNIYSFIVESGGSFIVDGKSQDQALPTYKDNKGRIGQVTVHTNGGVNISNTIVSNDYLYNTQNTLNIWNGAKVSVDSCEFESTQYCEGVGRHIRIGKKVTDTDGGLITISNCKFDGLDSVACDSAIESSSPIFVASCTFENCHNTLSGGAINSTDYARIVNSTFTNCKSDDKGGAVSCTGQLIVTNGNFTNCTANSDGGAIFTSGEGQIVHSNISDCTSAANGGGVCGNAPVTFDFGCVLTGNNAAYGGAVYCNANIFLHEDVNIHDNVASKRGGGINIDNGWVHFNWGTILVENNKVVKAKGERSNNIHLGAGNTLLEFENDDATVKDIISHKSHVGVDTEGRVTESGSGHWEDRCDELLESNTITNDQEGVSYLYEDQMCHATYDTFNFNYAVFMVNKDTHGNDWTHKITHGKDPFFDED